MLTVDALPSRLAEKVRPEGQCWTWTAHVTENGYGQVWWDGKARRPHRVSYELLVGPIPDGLTIDHLCRNRLCINPAHLEPVTDQENKRRWSRLVTHCPRQHEYRPENTRVDARGFRSCTTCHNEKKRERRAARRELVTV